MKPILFAEDATNYDNNGIGVLHDALKCDVYEEYNGIFDVELEYPADGEWSNEITDKRQILAKPNDIDEPHAFRIYEIQKDLEAGIIFVRGTSITDDLGGNLITTLEVGNVVPQQALDAMKNSLIEPTIFDFVSDIQTSGSAKWTRINPLQAINGSDNSMVKIWGGDIKRTNNAVYLYSRRGRDKVTVIRPGKNIDGFNMTTSTKGVVTKILPYYTYTPVEIPPYHMVQDYNGNWTKTQEYGEEPDVRQPELTVEGDVVVSPIADQYASQRYTPIDFSRDDYINTQVDEFIRLRREEAENSPTVIDNSGFPEELHQFVTDLLNQEASAYFTNNPDIDKPKVEIKTNLITLADSDDWEKYKKLETIQITDTVDVYVKKFNTDVEITIQSIRYDSLGERITEITAGSARNNLVQDSNRPFVNKIKELQEYVSNLENGVYNSIGRTADGRNRRFEGYTEPPASVSSEGDLWFKEIGDGEVAVYMYTGGLWLPKVSGPEVMERLVAMGIDANEVTIVNLDAGNITTGDLEITDALRITHQGQPIIEIVNGTVKITAPNLATQTDLENIELTPGPDGKTAYEVAVENGFVGTEQEWIDSLVGEAGTDGLTAYEVAVQNGFVGTEQEWLNSLVGPQGPQGIQGLQGPQGDQGIQGPAGADGVSSYTHIAYATGVNGEDFSVSHFPEATYIGMYVDTNPNDSTSYGNYNWSLIKGEDGNQGIQGPAGEDGLTPYFHVAWSNDDTGSTGFSTTDSIGKTHIGTYTDFISTDSSNPADYNWTKIKGEQGPQGIQGEQGPQGLQGIQGPKGDQGIQGPTGDTSYVHIAYATSSDGTQGFSTTNSSGAVYIGMYVDFDPTDSLTPSDYNWTLIKGAKGDQGIQGPQGVDGLTPYFHIAWANNSTGTSGFSTTVSTDKLYIGTYTDYVSADSTDPSDYNWQKVKGEQGPQGLQGLQGPQGDQGIQGIPGEDGVSSYTHIAYSTSADGSTGFSTTNSAGATYIGMYVDTEPTDSTSPSAYNWTLIKGADGAQGIQGPAGTDGQTPYLHIAYATNSTGTSGFSTTDATGKTYIGTYTDFNAADSTDAGLYTWAKIQGPQGPQGLQGLQGPQGDQGIQGPAGTSSYTHIAYATGTSGQNFSTSHFANATYIGMYVDNNPTDSTNYASYQWNLIKGADGAQGIQGPPGDDGLTPYFHVAYATNATGTTGFSTTDPTNRTYIGTYTDFVSADSTDPTDYIWAKFQGPTGPTGPEGPQGPQGIQGPAGTNGTSQYVHIRYSANANGNPMTTTPQSNTAYIGIANTTSSTAPTGYASYTWSLFKGPEGDQGIQGPTGPSGQTTYTWVKYADDSLGGNMTDTPSGKRFIGLAFNKTTQTESTSAGDYQWSPLYDNVLVGGRNLIPAFEIAPWGGGYTQDRFKFRVEHLSTDAAGSGEGLKLPNVHMKPSTRYVLSFKAKKITGSVTTMAGHTGPVQTTHNFLMDGISIGSAFSGTYPDDLLTHEFELHFTSESIIDDWVYIQPNRAHYNLAYEMEIWDIKLEEGNIATDWTPANEDIDLFLSEKASNTDLENLGIIVSDMSAEVNLKAGMGEFQALEEAFNTRVEQDIADKEQLAADLATMDGRVALVETIAGDSKLVTEFISTVITESEEGIYISNGASNTGILVSSDRISFIDNDTEVAYISNQTMQINHGIFVQSATISDFKFEKIPGTTILAITWVGD